MNREQFIKYSTDFSLLDNKSLEEIKNLLDEFPHFQSAWILYAKNLSILKDVRFESKLKTASVHVPDRRVLSRIISGTYNPGLLSHTEHDVIIPLSVVGNSNEDAVSVDNKEHIVAEFGLESETDLTTEPEVESIVESEIIEKIFVETEVELVPEVLIESKLPTEEIVATLLVEEEIEFVEEKPDDISLEQVEETIEIENADSSQVGSDEKIILPPSNAADRVLNNVDQIKRGQLISGPEYTNSKEEEDKLKQIIEQRLRELGIIEPVKVTTKEIIPQTTKLADENADFEQISDFVNSIPVSAKAKEVVIEDKDLLDFEFDGPKSEEFSPELEEIQGKNTVIPALENKKSQFNKPKKTELIDKFLASNPRIVPDREYVSDGSVAMKSLLTDEEELFSETLAKIYIKQGHFEKAMLTYEKLCLKYPEKNIYFAGQIEKLKELIKNK